MMRILKHYLPLLVMVIISGYIFYLQKGARDGITLVAQSSGYISLIILMISLVIGPLNEIRNRMYPVSTYFRRDLSISGGVLAVIHSVTGLFVHLRGRPWLYFLNKTDTGWSVKTDHFGLANYTGLLSLLIILILLGTSNDLLLKMLAARAWKNVQRLSYLAFSLILVHCYFYRIGKSNNSLIYSFYLPILLIVLFLQIWGAFKKTERLKTISQDSAL